MSETTPLPPAVPADVVSETAATTTSETSSAAAATDVKSEEHQMPTNIFYAMRLDQHVRMTVHDATDYADDLIRNSTLLKTIVNEHFETQIVKQNRRKGASNFAEPLIVYAAQSVTRTWSVLKPLSLDKPAEAALISSETRKSARESAEAGAMAFILLVDSVERLSHDTIARCTCSVRVDHAVKGARSVRKISMFRKRIMGLNKITHLSVQRVSTRCEDMRSKASLLRAHAAIDAFRSKHPKFDANKDADDDVTEEDHEWLQLNEEMLAAARAKAAVDIGLDTAMRLYAKQSLALQKYETDQRSDWLLNQVLLDSTAFDRVETHIKESAKSGDRTPLLVSFHTRNGCTMYGSSSYKFSTYEIFKANVNEGAHMANAEELGYNMQLLTACAAAAKDNEAGPDAIMMLISDEGFGPLFGLVSRSHCYVPNIMGMRKSVENQKKLIDKDRKRMTRLERTLQVAPLEKASLPSQEEQEASRATHGATLIAEHAQLNDEHKAKLAALNAEYNKQIDELYANTKK